MTVSEARGLSEGQLRKWLTLLRRPDQLADPDIAALLENNGRLPEERSASAVGRAAAEFLSEAIERLRPPDTAERRAQLPYLVLKMCFIDGRKLYQAAGDLDMSPRQMTRERARAIKLLQAEIEGIKPARPQSRDYMPEAIPTILLFMPRPAPVRAMRKQLETHRLVSVHGPPGVGKTALVAELANQVSDEMPVLWYRFRHGVNDTLESLLFELGEYLRKRGRDEVATYMQEALPKPEPALATRLALKSLTGNPQLIVLDDYHNVDPDEPIAGMLEEAVGRLPDLRVITISRHRKAGLDVGQPYEVPPLSRTETGSLLGQLGVNVEPKLTEGLHRWTGGVCQLVKLAASWLKTATPEEVARGIDSLGDLEEVQEFLLDNITELIGPDDQAILRAASVFRDRFTDDALAFVSQLTRGEVQDASLRLVRSYVATRSRGGDVAFFHVSVRKYVYARLRASERAELHERAALWYERQGSPAEARYHQKMVKGAGASSG